MSVLETIARNLHAKTQVEQAETLAALAFLAKRRAANPIAVITAEVAAKAQASLYAFVRTFWSFVEPDQPFVDNWHIHEMCKVLEAITRGELLRVIINIPPGTMKSLLVSVFWPAWEWSNNARLRYLTASYGTHLTIRDNLRVRDICKSDSYQTHYRLRFTGDQNVKELFNTSQRGWRFATSVGGAGTGEHPDRIIIDDPLTAQQARSDKYRKECVNWFKRTASTRGVSRKVRIVVVMQRLHEGDLTGHLLSLGGWEHIMWPMKYESPDATNSNSRCPCHASKPDPRDPRTEPGQLLWPALFPGESVRQMEIDLDPYGTAGQLQQRPAPEGGGLFKGGWFEIVDEAHQGGVDCRGWDTAGSEDGGDFTSGVKIRRVGSTYYVMDVRRGQWGPTQADKEMTLTAQLDGKTCRIREEKEPGASGIAVISAHAKMLTGFDYGPSPTSGDKVTRARPFRAQCEAGNVKLVRGPWNAAYIAELESFPSGAYDDQVDGSSASFNELATIQPVRTRPVAWG